MSWVSHYLNICPAWPSSSAQLRSKCQWHCSTLPMYKVLQVTSFKMLWNLSTPYIYVQPHEWTQTSEFHQFCPWNKFYILQWRNGMTMGMRESRGGGRVLCMCVQVNKWQLENVCVLYLPSLTSVTHKHAVPFFCIHVSEAEDWSTTLVWTCAGFNCLFVHLLLLGRCVDSDSCCKLIEVQNKL